MTIADISMPHAVRSSRWLLLASLALNLFFIGVGGALLLQSYGWSGSAEQPAAAHHSIDVRIEQIAATLPRQDGDKLRAAFQANRVSIDAVEADFHRSRDAVRAAVAAQPFDGDALRQAMARLRAARQAYDRQVQDFFAGLVPEISQAGRQKLADWHSSRGRGAAAGQSGR
jgi:uncharacterized membrane protein